MGFDFESIEQVFEKIEEELEELKEAIQRGISGMWSMKLETCLLQLWSWQGF